MELAVSSLLPCRVPKRPQQVRSRCAARKVLTGQEPPQISILREKVETYEKRAAIIKLEGEAADRQLHKHLDRLNSLKDAAMAQPIWRVTEVYDEQYALVGCRPPVRSRCRGAFNNEGDALLRRDLLQIRPENYLQDYLQYYVVRVEVNPADPTYEIGMEDDFEDGSAE